MNRIRRLRGYGLVIAVAAVTACSAPPAARDDALINPGLYTPDSTLGAVPSDETGYGTIMERGPMTDGCKGMFGPPGSAGSLVVDFSTQIVGQPWQPANVGAVWIEWVDPSDPKNFMKERFVKTLEEWANLREESLETWNLRRCMAIKEVDVVTGPTLSDHNMPHHLTWNGKDINGQLVPDGTYKLYIEVTEYEEQGPVSSYDFTKGPAAETLMPPDGPTNKGLILAYTPGTSGGP